MRIRCLLLCLGVFFVGLTSCGEKTPGKPLPPLVVDVFEKISETKDYDWQKMGSKIWKNEDFSQDPNNLVSWNSGEDVVSIGIGHFIWANELTTSKYEQSFPRLIEYIERKYPDRVIPSWLTNQYFPWNDREEFYKDKRNRNFLIEQLLDFCQENIDAQIQYFIYKFETTADQIINHSTSPGYVRDSMEFMISSEQGTYALLDYLNFKGAGIAPNENANGFHWGLLQVLEGMGEESIQSFAVSAKTVLARRAENDPSVKQWVMGWNNRIDTYSRQY